MSAWPSTRARRALAALAKIGWMVKRQSGSHRTLSRPGWADFVFAFHDDEEIGPRMLARIAKRTGLRPEDLCVALTAELPAPAAGWARVAHPPAAERRRWADQTT